MKSTAEDEAPTYRNLSIPSLSGGGASGAGFRELPVGFGMSGDDRPTFGAFATSTTGYSEEQTVYRSLSVAPPSFALHRSCSATAAKSASSLSEHQQHIFQGKFEALGGQPRGGVWYRGGKREEGDKERASR